MRTTRIAWLIAMASACAASAKTGDSASAAATTSASGSGGAAAAGAGGSSGGAGGGAGCTPNAKECDGTSAVKICNADGTAFDSMPCPGGTSCDGGVCGCSPAGATSCDGATVMKCAPDGQLKKDIVCPSGTKCVDGVCDDLRCPDEVGVAGATSLPTLGWPRYRHDNRSSGYSPAVVAEMPKLAWKVFVGGTKYLNGQPGGLAAGPVVNQNDRIFISGGDADKKGGHFYAFDAMGKKAYEFGGVTGYGYTTPAVRNDGTAYYSTADGHAYAVDPLGMQQWVYAIGFQNDCSPIVTHDGYVIYGTDTQHLFALKPDGKLLWQSDPSVGPGEVDSALAETCDGVILAGGGNGWTALDAATGATKWKVPTSALMSSPNVAVDGTMYGITFGGTGWAIDKNGKVLWSKSIGAGQPATDFARIGGKLFAVVGGQMRGVDAANGNVLWSQPVGNSDELYRHGGPVVDGRMRLYFSSNDGNLYAFDVAGKQLWKLPTSGIATPGSNSFGTMAIGKDGTLYVPGNDGFLYAFK